MAGQSEQGKPENFGANSTGPHVLLKDIHEPGAYVCHWSGDLLRVAEHGTPTETAPNLPTNPQDPPLETTKISDDPFVPISRARLVASNFDLDINF